MIAIGVYPVYASTPAYTLVINLTHAMFVEIFLHMWQFNSAIYRTHTNESPYMCSIFVMSF